MIFSPKKSFFLQFLLYFSVILIILGVIQATIGTLRLYNASEQEYEKLSPGTIYTDTPESIRIPEKVISKEKEDNNVIYYVAEDTSSISPSEKSQTTSTSSADIKSEKKENQEMTISSPIEIVVTPEEEIPPKGYKEIIQTVITGKYFRDALWKFPIIIDTERVEPRGQMYNESITLGSGMKDLAEVSKVLVHEIGHMIDIYALRKNLRKSDPSESFYKISWKAPSTIKAGIPKTAFISGYASTNQYEDFAESFVMYIFHNKEFQKRAAQNDFLKQKYNFLKTRIFGDAFLGSAYERNIIPKKIWDVTRVTIRGNNIDTIFAWIDTYRS